MAPPEMLYWEPVRSRAANWPKDDPTYRYKALVASERYRTKVAPTVWYDANALQAALAEAYTTTVHELFAGRHQYVNQFDEHVDYFVGGIQKVAPTTAATILWCGGSKTATKRDEATPRWRRLLAMPDKQLVFFSGPVANAPDELRVTFERLADEWEDQTWMYSFVERKAMNRAYQRIIGLGGDVVPLILERLATRGPDHWFWALEAITGENPAAESEAIADATEAWLQWGRERGLV